MDIEWWGAIGIGAIGLVLCSVLWLGRKDPAGKSYGPETAMGLGISHTTHHSQGPVDNGGADTGSASGGAGSS
jgi:hypothetical protein